MKKMSVIFSLILTFFFCVDVLNGYNSQLYKKTSLEKFVRSRARERPSPPNAVSAYTKALSQVDIDYPEEGRGENHIKYEGYAYLKAYGWKGTYRISASAYSSSSSQSGTWWSGVYREFNPRQTVSYSQNLDDTYAIDYFYYVHGKAAVDGIRYQSDPTNTFSSEADAHNFSYSSRVTWDCKRSKSSNIYNGSLCRMCN